jgi:hypothetical protein
MQLSSRDAKKVLDKIGVETRNSKHHVRGFVVVDGVASLPVHLSFGRKDLPGNVPSRFRKSLLLSVEEFRRLSSCTMDATEYYALVRDRLRLLSEESDDGTRTRQ